MSFVSHLHGAGDGRRTEDALKTWFKLDIYSCFEKGYPTEKHKSVRDNTERHDGLWLFTVASSSSRVFSAMEGGAMNTCLRVLKETTWILSF